MMWLGCQEWGEDYTECCVVNPFNMINLGHVIRFDCFRVSCAVVRVKSREGRV